MSGIRSHSPKARATEKAASGARWYSLGQRLRLLDEKMSVACRYRVYQAGMALGVISSVIVANLVQARQLDPHEIYEEGCAGCHAPHAGEFVRGTLQKKNGQLISKKTGRPLGDLLRSGHGNLSVEEIGALTKHFSGIVDAAGLFQRKFRKCHGPAVKLARRALIVRGDRLVGRYTDRDIEKFLHGHGRLEAAEVAIMLAVLRRQLR